MSGHKTHECVVALEKGETKCGTYAPDLPGLGAVAQSLEEAERLIREGTEIYVGELRAKGNPLPEHVSHLIHVAVAA